MITLIKNETIKLIFRKKTIVTLIAFILLIGLIGYGLFKQDESNKRSMNPKNQIVQLQAAIDNINAEMNREGISEADKQMYTDSISKMEEQIKSLKVNGTITVDWKANLKEQIQNDESQLADNTIPSNQKGYINKDIKINKYLLSNNIKPESDSTFNSVNYIKAIFQLLGIIFLAVGIGIFTSDMVSGEYTPPTAKFLLTQPVSRGKVLISKYITAVLSSIFLICLIEILAFIVVGLISGFGNLNYPVLVGEKYKFDLTSLNASGGHDLVAIANTAFIIPMYKFLVEALLLQILFIIACVSFVFMLSTVVKSSMVAMSISIVTVIAVTILQNISTTMKGIMSFTFIIYGNVASALTGEFAANLQEPNITLGFIILIFVTWTILSYAAAHLVFVKRDVLI